MSRQPTSAAASEMLQAADLATLRSHPITGPILDQPQLREAIALSKLSHRTPGLQMWTGDPGVGKTVAAEQLAYECNRDADARLKGSYRAFYFVTGGDVERSTGRQMKRGIYTVYEQMIGELSSGELRTRSETALAEEIVHHAKLINTQLIIIDEAGTKSASEIRGLALLSDIARQREFPLSLLLVGMDDLAAKMGSLDVLRSRTRVIVGFQSWEQEEALSFILARSSLIEEAYGRRDPGIALMLTAMLKHTQCRPREIETLLPEVDKRLARHGDALRAIEDVLGWRREASAAALAQSMMYSQRRGRTVRV